MRELYHKMLIFSIILGIFLPKVHNGIVQINVVYFKRGDINMDWYERTRMLIGNEAVEKLAQANVIIFGVGGVGSYISEAVARAGVGNITLVDNDTVAETNLNRQIVALKATIGSMKTQVMADRIKEINPSCNVKTINEFVLYDNIDDILTDEYSYVADAVDTVTAKLAIIMKAKELNVPVISSMGTGNKLHPELLVTNKRSTPGSISFVPSTAGLLIAGEIIRDICSL